MPRRLEIFCLFLCLLGAAPVGAADLPQLAMGADWMKRFLDPATREEAFFEFIIASDEREDERDPNWRDLPREIFARVHSNLQIAPCPGDGDTVPLYLVTYETDYSALWESREKAAPEAVPSRYPEAAEEIRRRSTRVGTPRVSVGSDAEKWKPGMPMWTDGRVLVFLDANGTLLWPFGGDNLISRGVIGDLNGDGRFERIDHINWGARDGFSVQTFAVLTVERNPRSLLRVLYNWHPREWDETSRWSYDLTDRDGDGIAEIELGPAGEDDHLAGAAEVVFRWDAGTGRYVGPEGGEGRHWQVFPADDSRSTWDLLKSMEGPGYARGVSKPAGERPGPAFLHWPEREPYLHRSLADLSDEELFRFMWRGTPHPEERRTLPDGDLFRRSESPDNLTALEPRAAALALAETNRTPGHRVAFDLVMETEEGEEPPERGQVVIQSLGAFLLPDFTDSIRCDGDEGVWVRTEHRGSMTYPDWPEPRSGHHERIGAKARWLLQTVWWLERIRSVSKTPDTIPGNRNPGFDDAPRFEVSYAIQGQDERRPETIAFPETYGADTFSNWAGHYDRRTAASLVTALWFQSFPIRWEQPVGESRDPGVLRVLLDDERVLDHWPIPHPIRLAIESAGDGVWEEFKDGVGRLAGALPDPDDFEREYRKRRAEMEEASRIWMEGGGGNQSYERFTTAEQALVPLEAKALSHPGIQLRDALELARKQFALADNREALLAWSKDAVLPGAAWALNRLASDKDGESAATEVLVERLGTRTEEETLAIFHELVKRDLPKAVATWKAMTVEQRRPLLPSLYEYLDPKEKGRSEWIAALLDLVAHPNGATYQATTAVRILVPHEDTDRFPDPAIDATLANLLDGLLARGELDYPEISLRLAACEALSLRDRTASHWKRLLDSHERSLDEEDGSDTELRSALVLQVARHPRLAQEFWQSLRLKEAHGRWDDFFFDAFAADLRPAREDIAKAATLSPEEPEGPRAKSWVSTSESLKGGFHSARQTIALWDESDAVTRAKMLVVFGLRSQRESGYGKIYGAAERVDEELDAILPDLQPDHRDELRRWIQWCGEGAPEALGGESLWDRQAEWLDELMGKLPG